ncbi:glycine--tRNA ligase subunit beta [Motiliproteus sp. SC1-56]|uniref:glycine--tRNA ligase subunit beta n=1 Tax=Motiliproteus sp. SC1-56 TaxID=2799565 RepID=UPI001A901F7E|nr:glycine--tRNA ligase subunit beta [Motiliproteus sp. SC1-56]
MSQRDFLVEIGTEELPPKALKSLSEAFGNGIRQGLEEANLDYASVKLFASPRRLAVLVEGLSEAQPDQQIEKRGPSVKAPEQAILGFARSCGVTPTELETLSTPKGDYFLFRSEQPGQSSQALLPEIVRHSLARLPIPKRMRWGARRTEFVRPVHWVLMLFGDEVVEAEILGRPTGRKTFGHRFHYNKPIELIAPGDYERVLAEDAYVIADFATRRANIEEQVTLAARQLDGEAVIDPDLLDEVTALVEWPVALAGRFEERFLAVPAEALVSSMKEHQKYFHVVDAEGAIKPYFITVSNIESQDPQQVIAGNEKVIRPRLADAAFFYETDKKRSLESRIEQLKPIVFQAQLGTVHDKAQRVATLAAAIAERIDGNPQWAERAGQLAKTDLVTEMVLEFTDLQGLMGYYYALNDGEPEEVAKALLEQYQPRFAGDQLPTTRTGSALAIADRLDTLVGLFGINQPPTGSKDPFALRRATLGVLRIIVEQQLGLDLRELLALAADQHRELPAREGLEETVLSFMLERFRAWYADEGVPAEVFLAVMANPSSKPLEFDKRVQAVNHFRTLPEAEALAAANKRVANILSKQPQLDGQSPDSRLFQEEAERVLHQEIEALNATVDALAEQGEFKAILERLASLQPTVDRFFDEVMVMAEDSAVRDNRMRLLDQLRQRFLKVADIALLG